MLSMSEMLHTPYCKWEKGKGIYITEDAPPEIVESYRHWEETRRPKPDENGIVTIVD